MASVSDHERIVELERQVLQLTTALASRVVIEQAKGVVAERYLIPVEDAFEMVRRCARGEKRKLRLVAGDVVVSVGTRTCPVRSYAA